MSEWSELLEAREALRRELEEATLEPRERGVVLGFEEEVWKVLREFKALEGNIESGSPNPPFFGDVFKSLLHRFFSLATKGPSVGGGIGVGLMERVWSQGIEAITSFLERKAEKIGVESWSIGASAGLPAGVSGIIMVNFRRRS